MTNYKICDSLMEIFNKHKDDEFFIKYGIYGLLSIRDRNR